MYFQRHIETIIKKAEKQTKEVLLAGTAWPISRVNTRRGCR